MTTFFFSRLHDIADLIIIKIREVVNLARNAVRVAYFFSMLSTSFLKLTFVCKLML